MEMSRLFRLKSSIQNYSWGSRDALGMLFGIANPDSEPQAEIWMGAHPKSPSLVEVEEGKHIPLDELIQQQGEAILGEGVVRQFGGQLPYLFKVLSAAEPLSIQAHPNKQQAEQGFKKENDAGISLNASFRNYKDDNHKPELIYALTPFRAMNGFRPVAQIIALFRLLGNPFIDEQLNALAERSDEAGLTQFYAELMQVNSERRAAIIKSALTAADGNKHLAFQTLVSLSEKYSDDMGVLSPLLLNVVELLPGEAMFLDAGTLHAYLEGTGLEVMASSDNVLRGGLTPKHVDVPELLATIQFKPLCPEVIKLAPAQKGEMLTYPLPVNDFTFSILTMAGRVIERKTSVVELLFCNSGQITVKNEACCLSLNPGDACLAPAGVEYRVDGKGSMAIIGCLAE